MTLGNVLLSLHGEKDQNAQTIADVAAVILRRKQEKCQARLCIILNQFPLKVSV